MPSFPSRLNAPRISGTGLVAALGGGVAGALLWMLTPAHPPVTLLMGALSPLPLMIAAIGFGPLAGVIAVVVGLAVIALFDLRAGHLVFAALQAPAAAAVEVGVFLAVLGLPAIILGLASRRRAAAATPLARPEEQLFGRLAVIAVAFAALVVSGVLAVEISASGGLAAFNAQLADAWAKILKTVAQRLPAGVDVEQVARQMTLLVPPLLSAAMVFFYLGNLWLAARVAQMSDLLGAPWPDLPKHMRVPRALVALLAVALPVGVLGAPIGLYARILSAALVAALAIQGLAVLHALTRGRDWRMPLLVLAYASFALLLPYSQLLWGVVGLLDSFFSFRDRQKPVVRKSR